MVLDYFIKTMTLDIMGMLRLEWKGTPSLCPKKGYIFSTHTLCMVKNGCFSVLSFMHDTSINSPPFLNFVIVVSEFIEVFSMDLPSIPPDMNIDFLLM